MTLILTIFPSKHDNTTTTILQKSMLTLPLQYDTHRGPDAVGQHKLTFTMDESVITDFNPMTIKKGTQFIVMLVEAGTKEAEEFVSETPTETLERFRKHMNSLINQYAELVGCGAVEARTEIKKSLMTLGLIKESTKELDLSGYVRAIAYIKDLIYEQNRNTTD